jgi:hypothetical protein
MKRITISANGDGTFQNFLGLSAARQGSQFISQGFSANTTTSFDVTDDEYEELKIQLDDFAARRVPIVESGLNTGRYLPLLTYTVTHFPASEPALHQIEGLSLAVDGSTQTLMLRGSGFIQGSQASAVVPGTGTAVLTLTAARKGPSGQLVVVNLLAPAVASSVKAVRGLHGAVVINVTPIAGGTAVATVAALINTLGGEAEPFVSAAASGAGNIGIVSGVALGSDRLRKGEGVGVAFLDLPADPVSGAVRSWLRIESVLPGNQGNALGVRVITAGVAAVAVSGNDIDVTPLAGALSLTAIAAQINSSAAATYGLVKATVLGTGADTLGGAAATVTSYADTRIDLSTTGAGLLAGGVADGESLSVVLKAGPYTLSGVVEANTRASGLKPVRARVRAQGNVTIATPGAAIDGIAMAAGQRFWSDLQTDPTEDGLWVFNGAATPATRAPELPAGSTCGGLLVSINAGTDAGTVRVVTSLASADIVGTSNLATALAMEALPAATGDDARVHGRHFGALSSTTNYVAQYAGGAAIDDAVGPFTRLYPERTVMVVGDAGTVACDVTIDGINARTGAADQEVIAHAGGATTAQGDKAWRTITRVRSSVDPVGTLDIRAGAGVYLGGAVTSINAVGVDGAYEAPAASSHAAEGVARFTTLPNGTRRYDVAYVVTHNHTV